MQYPTDSRVGYLRVAPLAVLMSAFAFSTGPILIHWTSGNINPFYFSFFVEFAGFTINAIVLWRMKQRLVDNYLASSGGVSKLCSIMPHFAYFDRRRTDSTKIAHSRLSDPFQWWKVPLLWVVASGFQYAFLAWAARYVETAVATTIYELWPVFVMYGLARHETTNREYLNGAASISTSGYRITTKQGAFIFLAMVGVVFVLAGQTGGSAAFTQKISFDVVIGALLALIAAILGSLTLIGSIAYGRAMFYQFVDERTVPRSRPALPIEMRGPQERLLLLWLAMLGLCIARSKSVPGLLVVLGVAPQEVGEMSGAGVLGALTLGTLYTVGAGLIRIGNIKTIRPEVNALAFLSPVLALAWLMLAGISVPRFDLFLIGAITVIMATTLMQVRSE